jgi:large subunit ribosomal protein L10
MSMRPEKIAIENEYRTALEDADFAILADCRGMTMEQLAELRGNLREQEVKLQIVRNRVFGKAAVALDIQLDGELLIGPTAVVSGRGDVTAVARALRDYARVAKLPVMKGGVLDGNAVSAADMTALSEMPSREQMLAMFVGTVAAPMTQLVGVMNAKVSSLVYALQAVIDKKSGE